MHSELAVAESMYNLAPDLSCFFFVQRSGCEQDLDAPRDGAGFRRMTHLVLTHEVLDMDRSIADADVVQRPFWKYRVMWVLPLDSKDILAEAVQFYTLDIARTRDILTTVTSDLALLPTPKVGQEYCISMDPVRYYDKLVAHVGESRLSFGYIKYFCNIQAIHRYHMFCQYTWVCIGASEIDGPEGT